MFADFIPEGDMGRFAGELPERLKRDFTNTMNLLRNEKFQDLLVNYPRAKRSFLIGYSVSDDVASEVMLRKGKEYQKPEDYLVSFARFVKENKAQIEAIQILLEKPKDWKTEALNDLRKKLTTNDFSEKELQKAHKLVYHKDLADIISMVKHAAKEEEPIFTAEERVDKAFKRVLSGKSFNEEQRNWLGLIRQHLITNLTIDIADFEYAPIFERQGGKGKAEKVFEGRLESLISEINCAIAA